MPFYVVMRGQSALFVAELPRKCKVHVHAKRSGDSTKEEATVHRMYKRSCDWIARSEARCGGVSQWEIWPATYGGHGQQA